MNTTHQIEKIQFRGDCVVLWFCNWDKPICEIAKKDGCWHMWFKKRELLRCVENDEKIAQHIFTSGIRWMEIEVNGSEIKRLFL